MVLYQAIIRVVAVGGGLSAGIGALYEVACAVVVEGGYACIGAVLFNAVSQSVIDIASGIVVAVGDLQYVVACIVAVSDCCSCRVGVLAEAIQCIIAVVCAAL